MCSEMKGLQLPMLARLVQAARLGWVGRMFVASLLFKPVINLRHACPGYYPTSPQVCYCVKDTRSRPAGVAASAIGSGPQKGSSLSAEAIPYARGSETRGRGRRGDRSEIALRRCFCSWAAICTG